MGERNCDMAGSTTSSGSGGRRLEGWILATSALQAVTRQQEKGTPPRLYLQLGTGTSMGNSQINSVRK